MDGGLKAWTSHPQQGRVAVLGCRAVPGSDQSERERPVPRLQLPQPAMLPAMAITWDCALAIHFSPSGYEATETSS